ncbi:MAG: hypothetical protein BWY36_00996 [Candidatus Diapherotrites archaeon ADurb.Bin253]|nr:MAG: hypothetical protein BWY36_00996 [Candidatus Diapherotrites archaeon ADurb.Bin253]
MKRYKRNFVEDLKKSGSYIYLDDEDIIVQNPFSISELNREKFSLGIEDRYSFFKEHRDIEELVYTDIQEIEEEIEKVREQLYNYMLGKIAKIQSRFIL